MGSDGSMELVPQERQKAASRRKKSATQVEVLERLYAEARYPPEEARIAISQALGLSEKQLQVWFTHRRYKDRRDGIEDVQLTTHQNRDKVDVLSDEPQGGKKGAIDLNSTDDVSEDGYPATVVTEERNDKALLENKNGMKVNNCRSEEKENAKKAAKRKALANSKESKKAQQKPAVSKPKVPSRAEIEMAAIIAVEAQLCGPLREDGPPLGLEFDVLPPDAFQHLDITEGFGNEGGMINFVEKTEPKGKWGKDLPEKKKRKGGTLKSTKGEDGC